MFVKLHFFFLQVKYNILYPQDIAGRYSYFRLGFQVTL